MRQSMRLSQNYHTPVSFWLSEPYKRLSAWIRNNNEMVDEKRNKK